MIRKRLQRLKVKPLAFDSFGVRSMATYVDSGDLKVLMDPAVSLGPSRYGLPPHPAEIDQMRQTWSEVRRYAAKSDVLIVTHYHYDHHDPDEPGLYKEKIVYLKDPEEKINRSQKGRASQFIERLDALPERIEVADGRKFQHGSTTIRFSPPVYHGTSPRLGIRGGGIHLNG